MSATSTLDKTNSSLLGFESDSVESIAQVAINEIPEEDVVASQYIR